MVIFKRIDRRFGWKNPSAVMFGGAFHAGRQIYAGADDRIVQTLL